MEEIFKKTVTVTETLTQTITEGFPFPDPTLTTTTSSGHHTTTSVAPIPTVVPGHPTFQAIDTASKRTLWVVTVLMGLSSLVFYLLSNRVQLPKRVVHYLVATSTTVSFIIYLALATGQGINWKHDTVKHSHKHVPNTDHEVVRQVLWLRYVNWFVTDPLILTALTLLSGLPGASLFAAIAADYVTLASGLFGTYAEHTSRRWVWFAISAIGLITVIYHIGVKGTRAASNRDSHTRRLFSAVVTVALITRALYPITLAAGALSLKLGLSGETILFAIHDIIFQGILGYWLVIANDAATGTNLYVDGFWSSGLGNEGAIRISEEEGA
ncbi:opsin family protein [Aspergillus stella-maris]|uniref:opsin family protein n=1 Tax=Aspergillus stella-maris TaxID=1810926 RepID=UPI003CCDB150